MIELSPLFFDDSQPGGRPETTDRDAIDDRYKWNVDDIYEDWSQWQADMEAIEEEMERFVALRGTLEEGPQRLVEAYQLGDQIGMKAYKLFRYPQLTFDVDQRDNEVQARLQRVQQLFAQYQAKRSWFEPELITLGEQTVMGWVDETPELEPYRFPISEVFRNQEHVLDEKGEQILAYGSRFRSAPGEVYRALTTADIEFNEIELSDGETKKVTFGEYGRLLKTARDQGDRRAAFQAIYDIFDGQKNTFAALYNSICQRDWAQAQARHYESCAQAALDGNNVPVSVLQTLIDTTANGLEPFQRYHRLRKERLQLDEYHPYDGGIPLLERDDLYPYDEVRDLLIDSVAPLGDDYQDLMKEALSGGWIDVYENEGKRSGAYSAGVYGVHPYMLLNYTDTLSDLFTLAHELGHTLHTMLSSEHQPFATSSYTIFVAEVASTTNEALLLEHMLEKSDDPGERVMLLQQAIDNITGTFYIQSLFADFELSAHRAVEQGQPITADTLNDLYFSKLQDYYGDAAVLDDAYALTWARIPHFFNSPFYVYQYATCYASSATIMDGLLSDDGAQSEETVERYLELLKSGGSDHPMEQLRAAGVDLEESQTVRSVVERLDELVDQLEEALDAVEG